MAISRRDWLAATAGWLALASSAQQSAVLRVGVLVNGAADSPLAELVRKTLREGFASLGYDEGRNLLFKHGYAEGRLDRLSALAAELVASGVDVIFPLGGPASRAAVTATSTIPVVFAIVTDPVAIGLVKSMQAPGGNATGVTNLDRDQAKAQMLILKEAAPLVRRVAILSDADIPGADSAGFAPIDRDNLVAAGGAGFTASVVKLKGPDPDLDATFAALANDGVQAVAVLEVPVTLVHRQRIARLAAARRMVSLFPGGTSDAGGVLTYGTTVMDTWKRMPAIADRIAKGAAPGSIAVETVTRRELVVNLKAASEVGLKLPPSLVDRADRKLE